MLASAEDRRLPAGWPRRLLWLTLLVGAALRVGALDKPLYIDEMTTVTVASQSLTDMPRVMRLIDASPALFPVLLHGWMQVSSADGWLRLLPALFGWLALIGAWRLARDVFGWRVALAAAAILALAPAQVHYAQYVRSYSLFSCLAVWHVWALLTTVARPERASLVRYAGLTALTAALLYTHYLSALLFVAEGVWLAVQLRRRRAQVLAAGLALVCGALTFLPGVPLLRHNLTHDAQRNLDRPDAPPLVELLPTLVAELAVGQRALGFSHPEVRRATLIAGLVVLPGLMVWGWWSALRTRRQAAWLLALTVIVPLALYVGSGRRLVAVRFFVPLLPMAAVLAGAGLVALRARALQAAAGVAILVVSAVPLAHFYARYQWSYDHARVAGVMRAWPQPADAILVVHPFEAFYYRHYLGPALPIEGLVFTPLVEQEAYVIKPEPLQLEEATRRALAAAARHPRFWVVGGSPRSFATDAGEEARLFAWLDATFVRLADLDQVTGADPVIRLYERR